MCQTERISNTVVRLGRRSYTHRMEVARPNSYGTAQLARLNRELDDLYELIYDDWRSITEMDYAVFGGQLGMPGDRYSGILEVFNLETDFFGDLHCSSRFTDMLCDAQTQYGDYSELDECPMWGMWEKEGGE